jgi:hypothetical protein
MHDLMKERLLSLKEARHEFPRRPSIPTLWRWIINGVKGVQLESIVIGGRRYTTWEACLRFIAARNQAAVTRAEANDGRRRQLEASQQALTQLGA